MIQTKQKGLQEVLIAAIKRATNEKTLVSFVKQIDWVDPLLFYAAGKGFHSKIDVILQTRLSM